MFSLRSFFAHLFLMRRYIMIAVVLLAGGIFSGAVLSSVQGTLEGQLEQVRQLAGSLSESSHPSLMFFIVIFFNNVIKSLLILYLGMFFGIAPVFFLVQNGLVLGYLFKLMADKNGWQGMIEGITIGILPHGIIEIPVLIIAGAYGLKLGTFSFRMLVNRQGLGKEFSSFVGRTLPQSVYIVILLLVAAAIESTITLWLTHM